MSRTSRWCVTLHCRLLVIVRSLQLVLLFSEECLELRGSVLLFSVGCWLLCDHYIWSYWFSKNVSNLHGGVLLLNVDCWLLGDRYDWSYWFSTLLVVHAFCTASHCDFLLRLYRRKFFHFLLYGDLPSHVLSL